VAECLAWNGRKTLLIDAGRQCTVSEMLLGVDRMAVCEQKHKTLYDLLRTTLGTIWSLYRAQNPMHQRIMDEVAAGKEDYMNIPRPFKTVIPNAARIAEATEPGISPGTFNEKFTSKFSGLYQELSREIVNRYDALA